MEGWKELKQTENERGGRMKYIVGLPERYIEKRSDGGEWLQMPVNVCGHNVTIKTAVPLTPYTESDTEQAQKEVYQKGLNDAWEAARQVSNMTLKTQKTIFSVEGTSHVFEKYSVAEAMDRIRNYESEKPEEYKFNPGDEIVYKTNHNIRVCVTSVNVGNWDGFALVDVKGVCTFGGSYLNRPFEDWEKTGREVEILKKAKEE